MAMNERGHAADAETQLGGHAGERGEQRDRLQARLGQQAVAGPDGVEEAGALRLRGEVDEIRYLDGAEHDRAIGHDQSERRLCGHGYLPV
jgi:hypothetical protein